MGLPSHATARRDEQLTPGSKASPLFGTAFEAARANLQLDDFEDVRTWWLGSDIRPDSG